MDCMLYGNGYVRISEDGFINHIRVESIYETP